MSRWNSCRLLLFMLCSEGLCAQPSKEINIRLFRDPGMQQLLDIAEVRADNVPCQSRRAGTGLYKVVLPGVAGGQKVTLSVIKPGYVVVNPHVLTFNAPNNNSELIDVVLCTPAQANDCKIDFYAISIEKLLRQQLRKTNGQIGLGGNSPELQKKADELTGLLQDKNQIRTRARELARLDREQASERIVLALDAFARGDADRAQQYIRSAGLSSRVDQFVHTEEEQQKEKAKLVSDLKAASVIAQYALQPDTALYYLKQAYLVDKDDLSIGVGILGIGVGYNGSLSYLDEFMPMIEKTIPKTETDRLYQYYCLVLGSTGTTRAAAMADSFFRLCNEAGTVAKEDLCQFYNIAANFNLQTSPTPTWYKQALEKAEELIDAISKDEPRLDRMMSVFNTYLLARDLQKAEQVLARFKQLFAKQQSSPLYDLYVFGYATMTGNLVNALEKHSDMTDMAVKVLKETYAYCINNRPLLNKSIAGTPGYILPIDLLRRLARLDFDHKQTFFTKAIQDFNKNNFVKNEHYFFAKSALEVLMGDIWEDLEEDTKMVTCVKNALTYLKSSIRIHPKYAAIYPLWLERVVDELEEDYQSDSLFLQEKKFIAGINNNDTKTLLNGYCAVVYYEEADFVCHKNPGRCDSLLQLIYKGYRLALEKKIAEGFSIYDPEIFMEGYELVVDGWINLQMPAKALSAADALYQLSLTAFQQSFTQENFDLHFDKAIPKLLYAFIHTGQLDKPFYIMDTLFAHYAPYLNSRRSERLVLPYLGDNIFTGTLGLYRSYMLEKQDHYKDTLYAKRCITAYETVFERYSPLTDTTRAKYLQQAKAFLQQQYDSLRAEIRERVEKPKKAVRRKAAPGDTASGGAQFLCKNRLSVKLFRKATRSFFSCRVRCRGWRSNGSVLMLPVTDAAGSS